MHRNAAGDALVFAACATGGGGGAATSEQRVESVTFADVDNITSTATTLTLAATTPIAVEFGDGAAEMLTGTGGETTFTIADSGVYMFEFEAIYPADGDRDNALRRDSAGQRRFAVIGRSTNAYLRNSGSPEDGLNIVLTGGVVSVPSDGLVVKAVLGNAYNQNSMDADGGKLSLVRINSGLRGATGPRVRLVLTGPARRSPSTACLPRPPSRRATRFRSPIRRTPTIRSASPATTSAPALPEPASTRRRPASLSSTWTNPRS